jgi:superfamily II DNA or RNA helicase
VTFATGSLVRTRGREWVVLPGSTEDFLMVRPLGGTDDETTGILTALEQVTAATFELPDPSRPGDYRSSRLLRDALRLGFRSSAGPFRSFGQIAVEPRPYQLVPLLMALRLDPVRLLIADDVGVGKTIEAALIAKELLAQGDAERLAVLCPPYLAEQWRRELREKFNVEAELVLPNTVGRLERGLPYGTSVFERYSFVVVSIDFIKGDRYKDEFVRTCPELVIVDEAHGCTLGAERGRQRRHELVSKLAEDAGRHLILVTATPHSGKEDAFRSLLSLLDQALGPLPDELSGGHNEASRRRLAHYLVQRRRGDIEHYLGTDTPLPRREDAEQTYSLSDDYRRLFDRALNYAREVVRDPTGAHHRQRVRWWSALALLRSIASSPAAAAETLRNRAAAADTTTDEEADDVGRRTVLDAAHDDTMEGLDIAPGTDIAPVAEPEDRGERRRLRDMAREADELRGDKDHKVQKAIALVKGLLNDGYCPIVFCRFIATAEYVAEQLRGTLPTGTEVAAVTGKLPPEERELRVLALAEHQRRVLVATDCLSEGVNLQDHFDAVMHYDLSWNPTRHEQREGRVDRFGQKREVVRTLTYYGIDNRIDGIVLDVLIRKSKAIRKSLGVSVPIPEDTDSVIQAVFEGLLLREQTGGFAEPLPGFDEFFRPKREELHTEWDRAAAREKRSRTIFAQEGLKPDEVAAELRETQAATGWGAGVRRFVTQALQAYGATTIQRDGEVKIDLTGTAPALRDAIGASGILRARFDLPVGEGELYLTRTAPLVEGLATHVLDTALDAHAYTDAIASRCGVIRTDAVATRTTLLLLRFRFDVITKRGDELKTQLAEDCGLLAFEGAPDQPRWIASDAAEGILEAEPSGNVTAQQAAEFIGRVVNEVDDLRASIDADANRRAAELLKSHTRVRTAARITGTRTTVEPRFPVDILGIYVLLPQPRA